MAIQKSNRNGAAPTTDLVTLADNIASQTKAIAQYLEANNVEPPSFSPASSQLPNTAEYVALYNSLKTSLQDLERLVDGPKRWLRSFVCQGNDLAALQVAFELDFFGLVPAAEEISMGDLAAAAGLDADRTARVLRMLTTHRIFQEPRAGFVAHSATSLVVHNDEDLKCAGAYTSASPSTTDCLRASPYESDSIHSPFNTRHGVPMFRYYAERPREAARFAKAMTGVAKLDRPITELRDFFPWETLSGTVVDVGGGNGHISRALALDFPHLNFIVQDGSPEMLAQGQKMLPPALQGRIKYMQYDFFSPQPLRDVAAFIIRQCTHNWCDRDVVNIFRAFVPGLEGSKPGTPLLINEAVLPELGAWPAHEERLLRQMDILMLIGLGAKQRTRAEFEDLLKQADPRYEVKSVSVDGALGLLEVHLNH
ncbi:O-methyltransferase [Sodiomyces alkalinus F11]|uniref:O-methyltransferase n=1 Tax=Sodiomyces alkalinus (strain CBS 110278 / VKM F-3762 / F11) TaxID=1314773 RepID=A0A3N2Q2E2_SODAK|nr:O-methyltransferase [Sodiomyces alkalinus F11]ROT40785.1 O-methyltransferase [Sodiomyces alkalinus F11]